MKNYFCCAIRNGFTLLGFVLVLTAAILFILKSAGVHWIIAHWVWLDFVCMEMLIFGIFFLSMTTGGLQTYYVYLRTRKYIQKYGGPQDWFVYGYDWYCDRVGVKLALRDEGFSAPLERP